MKDLAILRQRDGPRSLHRLLYFVSPDLARPRAQADPAMAVHAFDIRSAYSDDGVLDRRSRNIFRRFDRFLNRGNGFIQLDDHAFARTARVGDSMPPVAQAELGHLCYQRARLGAAYINRRQEASLLVRHSLMIP